MTQRHEHFMKLAIEQANLAADKLEVPVGAVLVMNDELVSVGRNSSIQENDPSAHAEMNAIRSAGKQLQNYRFPGATLYVTLEPCPMCAGLLVHSRISRLVFGAYDYKSGSCGSVLQLAQHDKLNHRYETIGGVLEEECARLLSDFFAMRRAQKKKERGA